MASPSPDLGPNRSASCCGGAAGEGSRGWGPKSPPREILRGCEARLAPPHRETPAYKGGRAARAPPSPSLCSLRAMSRRCALVPWALLALLGLAAAQEDESCCGPIVPKREWGAQASECTDDLKQPVRYVVVSHTAGSVCNTPALCRQQAQNVQHYHKQTLGFCDVGYK